MTTKTKMLSTDSDFLEQVRGEIFRRGASTLGRSDPQTYRKPQSDPHDDPRHVSGRRETCACGSLLFTDLSLREGAEWFLHDSAGFVSCGFALCR